MIREVVAGDLESQSGDELSDEAAELSRAMGMLSHRLAEVTDEVRRRGWYELQGFLSVTRWLAVTADMDNATAQRHVNLGKALRTNPLTAERSRSGELSAARVQLLTRAARAHPAVYGDHEDMLLGLASEMDLRDLRRAVGHWSNCADATAAEQTFEQQQESSYLFVSVTPDQMVKIDGLLDKETGEAVLTALDAAMTPEARTEGAGGGLPPAPMRRAEAFGEICRRYLAHHPGTIGGHRPQVSVIVDLDTLQGRGGKRCELTHSGTITAETARRILCDAEVTRILVAGDSMPLEMGRAVRTATPAQLKALAVRDGGCVWPGCDRPPAWCDAHHKTHWLDGGDTDLDDLELLCRRHHVLAHRLDRLGGRPTTRRSDGADRRSERCSPDQTARVSSQRSAVVGVKPTLRR